MKDNKVVYRVSITVSIIIAVLVVLFRETIEKQANAWFATLTEEFGWLYLLSVFAFVVFILILAFSKYGNIRLGRDDEKPEHSLFSWFAMLFCAGMGIGLVFWGISEPISHYISPPVGIEAGTPAAIDFSMKSSFMHWGIHPWSLYAVVGLPLAYFQYRKHKPGLLSSTLEPLIGSDSKRSKYIKNAIDIAAIWTTVAGISTSLGLGIIQITNGGNFLFNIDSGILTQIIIIIIVTGIFLWSSISGINKGVKILSNFNVVIAILLMVLAVIVGSRLEMANNFTSGLGNYINDFFKDSLFISEYVDTSWVKNWRVFYWGWWITWAPFVGIFIARISKGRTIREFVLGVVAVPTLVSMIWFSVFGTMGLHLANNKVLSTEAMEKIAGAPEIGLFTVMQHYPLGTAISILAVILLITFFITSADSGTFVLAMMSSDGDLNPKAHKKIVWGITQSVLAIGLLVTGGLKPAQILCILGSFPLIFIICGICLSLIKELRNEYKK
ncbi:MAG: BCCT family transporter [Eubacteriales bacterium]|nr:BCCT family transporter [Eubacteriales bacterium]